jgi:hypothetical protein
MHARLNHRSAGSTWALVASVSLALLIASAAPASGSGDRLGRVAPLAVEAATPSATTSLDVPSVGLVVTTTTAVFAGFTYVGLVAVAAPAGPVTTMEFTAGSAHLTDLRIEVPCTAVPALSTGVSSFTAIRPDAEAVADGLHLYATSVAGTSGETALTWTPEAPPPVGPLGDVTLTAVRIDAAWMSMPSLSAPGLAQHTAFCSP